MEAADIPAPHGGSLAALASPLGPGCAAGSLLEGILPFLVLLLLVPFREVDLTFSCRPRPPSYELGNRIVCVNLHWELPLLSVIQTILSRSRMSQMCQYRKFAAPLQQLHFGTWMQVDEPSTASKGDE
jgi:hypothetical protein